MGGNAPADPGLAWPELLGSFITDFLRENVRDSCVVSSVAPFLATSLADFHLSLACTVSLALLAAASLDFACLFSLSLRT